MKEKEQLLYGGELCEELTEVYQLSSTEAESKANTHTLGCGHFLTIYCC